MSENSKVSPDIKWNEHFEKNPFKKHLSIMLPSASHPLQSKKKIKKKKQPKKHASGEISSSNDSPALKPEIKVEELNWKQILTKINVKWDL